jgi:Zn-dependent M16 (insulinase) family peptidase
LQVRPVVDAFVAKLPPTSAVPAATPWAEAVTFPERVNEGFAITTQVNYVAAGTRLYEPGEMMDGSTYAVARFLSRGYLWDNVRVVGGAYGGGCALNPSSGGFAFSSYRDPNLQGTLDVYAKTVEVLENLEIDDAALEQAIVGAAGDLDSPMTSQSKGYRALLHHLTGTTTEMRQRYRDEVIGTTREAFAAFAAKLKGAETKVAVFGSKDMLEQANAKRADDEQIQISAL